MENPKISIIVPVYKVEPYLRRCLESIVNQTYRNLEIIVVDDGSPDHCGAICDEYAAKDERMKVIHQANRGLSSARNTALTVMTGNYVGFTDSDDWIEPNMFEILLKEIERNKADIAVCGRYKEYPDHRETIEWPGIRIMDKEEALGELLQNEKLQNLVWDKLYRRELFEDIWFPVGKTFEDIAVMYRLFLRSKKVVCVPEVMYHYFQRSDSIVGNISLCNRFVHYEMVWKRYEALKDNWPQFESLMLAQCESSAAGLWTAYYLNPKNERKKYRKKMKDVSAFVQSHKGKTLEGANQGLAGRIVRKLVLYDTWWSFSLAYIVGKIYQHKHGRLL